MPLSNNDDSFQGAQQIGALSLGNTDKFDNLGSNDKIDVFSFSLTNASTFAMRVSWYNNTGAKLNMGIYDANYNPVSITQVFDNYNDYGDTSIKAGGTLPAGNYFAAVGNSTTSLGDYRFRFSNATAQTAPTPTQSPDLTMAYSANNTSVMQGNAFSFDFFTKNIAAVSGASSGILSSQVYLDGTLLNTKNYSGATISANLSIPETQSLPTANLAVGTHTVTLKADTGNAVAESNESNNSTSFNFTVQAIAPAPAPTTPDINLSSSASVTEGNSGSTPMTFTVTRTGSLSAASSVDYAISSGAVSPDDFVGNVRPFGTVAFAPNESTKTITLNIAGDTVVESDEAFTLLLSNPSNGKLGNYLGNGTIVNDDKAAVTPPVISISSAASVNEGNSGTTPMTFTVTRIGDITGSSSVAYALAGGVIQADDFANNTPPSGTVPFAPNEASKTITVNIAGDTVVESNESFKLFLSSPTNATLGNDIGTGTIVNDDAAAPTLPEISVFAYASVTEGNSGSTPMTFTVTRTGNIAAASSVDYSISSGAVSPDDFVGNVRPSSTVTFAPNESTKTITLNIAGDSVVEPDEAFTLLLSNPTNGKLGNYLSNGTIVNDDKAAVAIPVISISTAASVNEGNSGTTPMTFSVTRTGNTTGSSTVTYALAGGVVQANDFANNTPPSGTVPFAPNETSKTITVNIAGDTVVESNENFQLFLSSPTNATLGNDVGTGTIVNDDVNATPAPITAIPSIPYNPDGIPGQAYRIYNAAFSRMPDASGLDYWTNILNSGKSLVEIATGFMQSPEFKTMYGTNPTNDTFVTKAYNNVLHRDPEAAGKSFWVNDLNAGKINQAAVLAQISESGENKTSVLAATNNVSFNSAPSTPPTSAVDNDGTVATAQPLGTLVTGNTPGDTAFLKNRIGGGDNYDFYKFHLDAQSTFAARLSWNSTQPALKIYQANGTTPIANTANPAEPDTTSSANLYPKTTKFAATLNAGDYYVQVDANGSSGTDYGLRLSNTPTVKITPPAIPNPKISLENAVATEGYPLSFKWTLDKPATVDTSFKVTTYRDIYNEANKDGISIDYEKGVVDKVISVPKGETSGIIYINTLNDNIYEPTERMALKIVSASGLNIPNSHATGTINDDDIAPSPAVQTGTSDGFSTQPGVSPTPSTGGTTGGSTDTPPPSNVKPVDIGTSTASLNGTNVFGEKVRDWTEITPQVITNQYLYGQKTRPSDLADSALIRPPLPKDTKGNNIPEIKISNIDAVSYMKDGPGKFASITNFKLVQDFFNKTGYWQGKEYPLSIKAVDTGQNLFEGGSIIQTNYDDAKLGERAYVWGNTSFAISKDTVFEIDGNKNRTVSKCAVLPGDENFDFISTGIIGPLANDYLLQPNVDPFNIGRTVGLIFDEKSKAAVPEQSFNESSFKAETYKVAENLIKSVYGELSNEIMPYYNINYSKFLVYKTEAISTNTAKSLDEVDKVVQDLWNNKITQFLNSNKDDPNAKLIAYGTSGDDVLSNTWAINKISKILDTNLEKLLVSGVVGFETIKNGITFVSGKGADTLEGGEGNDELWAGDDKDTLWGGKGNDTLWGGNGDDFLDGGAGQDDLYGGYGNNTFHFWTADDANGDVIHDFISGADKIDLSEIDAEDWAWNDTFKFIGGNSFSKTGELRFSNGILEGNTTGDTQPEFTIALTGVSSLNPTDLVL